MSSMNLDSLLIQRPMFHEGGTVRYGVDEVLRFLDRQLKAKSRTIETGAGLSTVLFALKGCRHICITPSDEEVRRIKEFCLAEGVSLEQTTFIIERSEDALPKLKMEEIDLAFIDGGHGFPIPFLDWLYIARILRPGGLLLVDDTQLWTGYVLKRFLRKDPGWRYLGEIDTNTAIFEKLHNKMMVEEWCYQPFIIRQQRWLGVLYHVRRMWSYLRCGKFDKMIYAVRRRTLKLFGKR